jgi:signal transduction histidine kinase/CheY-like chemotaxis protein
MSSRLKLNIGVKIFLINGAIILLMAGALLYIFSELGKANIVIQEQEKALKRLETVSAASSNFSLLRYWLTDLAVSWQNEDEVKAMDAKSRLDKILSILKKTDPELVAKLIPKVAIFTDSLIQSVDAYIDGNRVVGNSLVAEARQDSQFIEGEFNKLLVAAKVSVESSGKKVVKANATIRKMSLLLIALATVLGVILSLLFSRNISRRLGTLMAAMKMIAAGNIKQDILVIESKDEIGQLRSAYNDMTKTMREIAKQADDIAADRLSGDYALRGDLAIAFAKMTIQLREKHKIEKEREVLKGKAEAANQAKSSFLANMSHEIRTPMNAIFGYSQILMREADIQPNHKKSIKNILSSADHLLELINDVLDLSKIEAGQMEISCSDFDLPEFIKTVVSMFKFKCEEKDLAFVVDVFDDEHLWVYGDETKLKQVLINLIGNAVKFTDSGGEVKFRASSCGKDIFKFEVIDNGAGIPKSKQESIFQPFKQSDEGIQKGGTGLGLAISKKQVTLMEGELSVESTPGNGARFYFSIPLVPAKGDPVAELKTASDKMVVSLKEEYKVRALIADDLELNRDVLGQFLTGIGVEVMTAENGKEAVEKVREYVPDIVFMDVRMPVMGGIEAVSIIRKDPALDKVKIVTITASVLEHQRKNILEAGTNFFISKPFRVESIFDCLQQLLNVEFIYEEDTGKETAPEKLHLEFSSICLTEDLFFKLIEGAGNKNIPKLEQAIEELEQINEKTKVLAENMRIYLDPFNMEELKSLLEEVDYE